MIFSRIRQASYCGIHFHVAEATAEFGRRKKVHEFFGRDEVEVEDLGRGARRYPVEGYLVGHDYGLIRDLLIRAVEKDGPGTLIHPYHGMVEVMCLKFSVSEHFHEAHYCKLRFDFIEAPKMAVPAVVAELVKAEAFMETLALEFIAAFSVVGVASYVLEASAGLVTKASGLMASSLGLGAVPRMLYTAAEALAAIRGDVSALIRMPKNLAVRTMTAMMHVAGALDLADFAEGLFGLRLRFSRLVHPAPATRGLRQLAANGKALTALLHHGAILAAIERLAGLSGHGRAVVALEVMVREEITAAMAATRHDISYVALAKLKHQLTITKKSMFKEIASYEPTSLLPFCFEHTGSLAQAPQMIEINAIANPGFIPLRVLEVPDA